MKKTIIITLAVVGIVAGYTLLKPVDKPPSTNQEDEQVILVNQNAHELPDDSVSSEPSLILDQNKDIRAYLLNLFSIIGKNEPLFFHQR
jgi:hypothetical protein